MLWDGCILGTLPGRFCIHMPHIHCHWVDDLTPPTTSYQTHQVIRLNNLALYFGTLMLLARQTTRGLRLPLKP